MQEIRAFIGHSFGDDDAEVVSQFLKYFQQLSSIHQNFSWEHAESAEPKSIAEKVISLIANKNVFIGICTKKECVIAPEAIKEGKFCKSKVWAPKDKVYWKTSDWIIQEIGLAKGRNLELILLIEADVRIPSGLQGDTEFIPFIRTAPEKSFGKIIEMISSLSPKRSFGTTTMINGTQSAQDDEKNNIEQPGDIDSPMPEWTQSKYERALFVAINTGSEERVQKINEAYLATEYATQGDNKISWEAEKEYLRIAFGNNGSLNKLKKITEDNSTNSKLIEYLARAYEIYGDHEVSARTYEIAARHAFNNKGYQLEMLKYAAKAYSRAGEVNLAESVINLMKAEVQAFGVGEQELLSALKGVAEVAKENEILIGAMEHIVERDPSDTRARFDLAYKHSEIGNNELALFHYLRIPELGRSPIAWNNLGVEFDQFNLPSKSVNAYQMAAKSNETLAMSNLALKFIAAGFLEEAQMQCDDALKIENYHQNIPNTMLRIRKQPDEENKKEEDILREAKPISDFYAEFGRALSHSARVTSQKAGRDQIACWK
ncbi:MAG: hypothetical protein ABL951_10995 [Alphaproteobacteria bacterium]